MPRGRSTAVVASPAAAAETVIATLTGLAIPYNAPVDIEATCDVTIGTAGVTATLRLREGATTGGTAVAAYGPFTVVAGNRYNLTINAVDSQALESGAMAYALTLQVGSASAQSTVNNVYIGGLW